MKPKYWWKDSRGDPNFAYFVESLPCKVGDPLITIEYIDGYIDSIVWDDKVDGVADGEFKNVWGPVPQSTMILR